MPNKFTAKHDPPIESVLTRAVFFGGHEDESRIWRVMHQFTESGAAPDASYGLLLIGVNAMILHHSTSEDEEGRKSAVCSIPGTPLVFVCDAAAVQAKPFGQQAQDFFRAQLRQQGIEPCPACGGAGTVPVSDPIHPERVSKAICGKCRGEGMIKFEPKAIDVKAQDKPADPNPKADMAKRLRIETGLELDACVEALGFNDWDFERALKWLDDKRNSGAK